jgi:signal transduction histidine kinase
MKNDLMSIVKEKLNEFPDLEINENDLSFRRKLISFFESNKWFDVKPKINNTDPRNPTLIIEDNSIDIIRNAVCQWLYVYGSSQEDQFIRLYELLNDKYPKTSNLLHKYYSIIGANLKHMIEITEYLLYHLKNELYDYTNYDMRDFVKGLSVDKSLAVGMIITDFFAWAIETSNMNYTEKYKLNQRTTGSINTTAYDGETYLRLIYYLFNPDYIDKNNTMERISNSIKSADAFLYLSLHCICGVRDSDLVRLPHPFLESDPELILETIANGLFSELEARKIVNSIELQLQWQPYTPSKTSNLTDVPDIKFFVPESSKSIIGTYFAAAEAHRQITGIPNDQPLVRIIRDAFELGDAMGEDFFQLFLEQNFSSRRANKAYLQAIELFADDLASDISAPKGYMLAALARSHKGTYAAFADTTEIYLKDANLSGLTPEFVARELFERGVCSFIPAMLLKMLENEGYSKLPVTKQTLMIKELNITPNEIENIVLIIEDRKEENIKILNQIIDTYNINLRETLLEILHNIGSGSAASKNNNCMCLLTAMNTICNDPERQHCIGCKYEIKTKSIIYLLAGEFSRLKESIKSSKSEIMKNKFKAIISNLILPSLEELLENTREIYGEKVIDEFEDIIRRYTT